MISQKTIDKIKEQGVFDIASKYTILKKASNNLYIGRCPHNDHNDSDPSFRIFINDDGSESWACMGCHCGKKDERNYGSDNIAFVRWLSDNKKNSNKPFTFIEAINYLSSVFGIPLEKDKNSQIYDDNLKLANIYREAHTEFSYRYLFNRGLSLDEINKWNIGYLAKENRITFPIYNIHKQIIGFSNRLLNYTKSSTEPKYSNSCTSEIFQKKNVLYGIQFYNNNNEYLYITEGQLDVILANKYGMNNVVCTLGCSLNEEHMDMIKKINKTPVLCYDNDEAGQKGIKKAAELLKKNGFDNTMVLVLPLKTDLAEIALKYKEGVTKYVNDNTTPYVRYAIMKILNKMDNMVLDITEKAKKEIDQFLLNNDANDLNMYNLSENYVKKRLHMWE